jgi:hypothetical protein
LALDESWAAATPVTPEEAFQAIGRLRKDARDEIDRLIRFLDTTDDYVSRELEDSIDEHLMDDNELEPSLGWTDMESRRGNAAGTPEDTELDECDDEPSLGSHVLPSGAVSYFMPVGRDGSHDCEGDEIDSEVDDAPV